MAESQSVDTIVAAVADYVARRLVERERALTVDSRVAEEPRSASRRSERAGDLADRQAAHAPVALSRLPARASRLPSPSSRRRGAGAESLRRLGDALSLFLMLLGSITLALLLGVGGYWAWTTRLRDLWAHWIGAPPF